MIGLSNSIGMPFNVNIPDVSATNRQPRESNQGNDCCPPYIGFGIAVNAFVRSTKTVPLPYAE